LAALALLLLCGCAHPVSVACEAFDPGPSEKPLLHTLPPTWMEAAIHSEDNTSRDVLAPPSAARPPDPYLAQVAAEAVANGVSADKDVPAEPLPTQRPGVLLLSGGGQWGAFGAGYLFELKQRGALPRFTGITGVSTGAMQALLIALDDYDLLKRSYSPRDEREIVQRRPAWTAVVTGSVAGLKPLRKLLSDTICAEPGKPCRVDELAALPPTEHVLIGFVRATDGQFVFVDVPEVARHFVPDPANVVPEQRIRARECLVGAALASAGMPFQFQQVRIGNHAYYDGGVRQSVFEAAIVDTLREASKPGEEPVIYVVRNGPTRVVPELDPKNNADTSADAFVNAQRGEAIATNQLEVASIAGVRLLNPDSSIYLVTADEWPKHCVKRDKIMFDPVFMECLRGLGARTAQKDKPPNGWIELPTKAPPRRPPP